MTQTEAKEYIKTRATEYLGRDKSGKGYVCPLCGSGTGKNGTGVTTKDNIHFTCWKGCFQFADIFDIIGLEYNLTSFPDKLKRAAEVFNVQIDDRKQFTAKSNSWDFTADQKSSAEQKSWESSTTKATSDSETETDYTDFFTKAAEKIENTNYHRGISLETLKRYNVGYVENWTHPKAPSAPPSPRLIIPTSPSSYLARDTRSDLTAEQQKYAKSKVGEVHLFNTDALNQIEKPVIIVEEEIDALSIIDVGGEAIGLGSLSNIRLLLDFIKDKPPVKPLIIALDNDDAGNRAYDSICTSLIEQNIPFYRVEVSGK